MGTRCHGRLARARSWCRAGALLLAVSSLAPPFAVLGAQVIPIKTAPVADGDQFAFFPSANLGMGGVSIALPDSMLDPFTNPATGTRLRRGYLMSSPTIFSVSGGSGGGQTLPVGALLRSGSWFSGLVLTAQRIGPARTEVQSPPPPTLETGTAVDVTSSASTANTNQYGFAMLGRTIAAAHLSVAASVLVSGLDAVDGTERLYPESQSVQQAGHASDLRLGVLKEWTGGRSFQALLVHSRYGMSHDVTYADPFWDPSARQVLVRPRLERDADRTRVWGLQLRYERPLGDSGWRVGAAVTANRQSRPGVPSDAIMSIGQDRGRASAFDVGLGVSKSLHGSTFGIDAVYEPIWSHTWAVADTTAAGEPAGDIAAGAKTLDNQFRYANAIIRAGAGQSFALDPGSSLRLQIGLQVHAIDYRLDQRDVASDVKLRHDEQWMEWTRTWGVSFRFTSLEIHYLGRLTTGIGRAGVTNGGNIFVPIAVDARPPIPFGVPALTAPVLGDVHVTTHQLSVSVPIR